MEEVQRITPNFGIVGGVHNVSGNKLTKNPLSAHAGGRQRRQLRRLDQYPGANEPKPWSRRSQRRGTT